MNTTLTKPRTLAEQLPHTLEKVRRELKEATDRLNLLLKVHEQMQSTSESKFEAVIPQNRPNNQTMKEFGTDAKECIKGILKKRGGNPYLFLNLNDGVSVAVSPEDIESAHRLSYQEEDGRPHHRVVWTTKDRGIIWLT